jgi:hypothetical protein
MSTGNTQAVVVEKGSGGDSRIPYCVFLGQIYRNKGGYIGKRINFLSFKNSKNGFEISTRCSKPLMLLIVRRQKAA